MQLSLFNDLPDHRELETLPESWRNEFLNLLSRQAGDWCRMELDMRHEISPPRRQVAKFCEARMEQVHELIQQLETLWSLNEEDR
jgi:hypothetical protein